MIRRSLSALLVAATVASGAMLAAPADAATAGGSCTLNLPRRIVVDDLVVISTASASGSCTKAEAEAVWTTDPSFDVTTDDEDALDDVAGFAFYLRGDEYKSYGRDAVTFVFAPNAKWGKTTFYPAYAGRGCNEDGGSCKTTYVQNTPTTDIRLASRSALEATRSKGIVTLRGTGKVFSVDRQRYKARIVNALFQSRAKGGAWATLRAVKTTYKGRASMSVRATKGTQFRFVTLSDAHWWTSVSKGVTR